MYVFSVFSGCLVVACGSPLLFSPFGFVRCHFGASNDFVCGSIPLVGTPQSMVFRLLMQFLFSVLFFFRPAVPQRPRLYLYVIIAVVSCEGGIVSVSTFGSRVSLSHSLVSNQLSLRMFRIQTLWKLSRVCQVVEWSAFTSILPMAPDMSQSPPWSSGVDGHFLLLQYLRVVHWRSCSPLQILRDLLSRGSGVILGWKRLFPTPRIVRQR